MRYESRHASPQKRAEAFFRYGWMGLAAFVVGTAASLAGVDDGQPGTGAAELLLSALPALILFVALIRMFQLRRSDEFVLQLWGSGTSAAFIALVGVSLATGFLDGLIDGARGTAANRENGLLATADVPEIATVLAFFLTINLQRLRGEP